MGLSFPVPSFVRALHWPFFFFMVGCAFQPTDYELASRALQAEKSQEPVAATSQKGNGSLTFGNGDVYEGDLVAGKPHGRGTLGFAAGGSYKGEFLEGWMQGEGELRRKSGLVYVGGFARDRFEGKGKLTDAKGNTWQGRFVDGEFREGRVLLGTGGNFTGQVMGERAEGTFVAQSGAASTGKFSVDGTRFTLDGEGVYKHPDTGTVYKGVFTGGKKDGTFLTTLSNGVQLHQIWKQDRLAFQTFGGRYLADRSDRCDLLAGEAWILVSGRCVNGVPEGHVVITLENSTAEVDATFTRGLGKGTLKYSSGKVYRGGLDKMLRPHGTQVAEVSDGKIVYAGGFSEGIRQGVGVCYEHYRNGVDCRYEKGKRVDIVHRFRELTGRIETLSRNHRAQMKRQVEADIKEKKDEIDSRYRARVRKHEQEIERYRNWTGVQAFVGMMGEGAQTGDISARHMQERERKIEQKLREIEQEKATYRRTLAEEERNWARWRQNKLRESVALYENQYWKTVKLYFPDCGNGTSERVRNAYCYDPRRLTESQRVAMNDLLKRQSKADSEARDSASKIAANLGEYQRESAEKWQEIDRADRAKRLERAEDARQAEQFRQDLQATFRGFQAEVAEMNRMQQQTQEAIEQYNRAQEEAYRRKVAEHQRQQALDAQREYERQKREYEEQYRARQERDRNTQETLDRDSAAVYAAATPATGYSPSSGSGGGSVPKAGSEGSSGSSFKTRYTWDDSPLSACRQDCESAILSDDNLRVNKDEAVAACEIGCGKLHNISSLFNDEKLDCGKASAQLPGMCQEENVITEYCMKALGLWRASKGCYK